MFFYLRRKPCDALGHCFAISCSIYAGAPSALDLVFSAFAMHELPVTPSAARYALALVEPIGIEPMT